MPLYNLETPIQYGSTEEVPNAQAKMSVGTKPRTKKVEKELERLGFDWGVRHFRSPD